MLDHQESATHLEIELNEWKAKAMMRQNLIEYIKAAIKHELSKLPKHTHIHEVLLRIDDSTKL